MLKKFEFKRGATATPAPLESANARGVLVSWFVEWMDE